MSDRDVPPVPSPAYAPPAVYAPPYVLPGSSPAALPPTSAPRSSRLGVIALFAGIAAAIVAPIIAAIASFSIGIGVGSNIAMLPTDAEFDWSVLSPVRPWVTTGEITFWLATALGLWALVQGIIAIVRGQGRTPAIVAVILAGLGPVIFGAAVMVALTAGVGAGSSIGG